MPKFTIRMDDLKTLVNTFILEAAVDIKSYIFLEDLDIEFIVEEMKQRKLLRNWISLKLEMIYSVPNNSTANHERRMELIQKAKKMI